MPWWSWFPIGGLIALALVYRDWRRNPQRVIRDAPGGDPRRGLILAFILGMATLGTPLWMALELALGV
jgi:hypothetical protein